MKRPLLLGHRGARASKQVPENTLASFELCLQHGCDGFEFDVRQSANGEAVICHDPMIRGLEIARTPQAGLRLPTLTEVLQSFGGRAFVDIELKVRGLERTTSALLREYPPQRGYVVSSFLPEALVGLHDLDPTIPLGFIFDNPAEMQLWQSLPVDWVMPQVALVSQGLVERLHGAGKKAMAWTANDADAMRKLTDWGVDAILADDTELAAKVLCGP